MIIKCHNQTCGHRKISKELHIPINTIRAIVRKWKKHITAADLQRIGQPQQIGETSARWIARTVKKNPFATRSEVQHGIKQAGTELSMDTINSSLHRVGLHSRSPRKNSIIET